MTAATLDKEWASFGGRQQLYTHQSEETGTPMTFSVYLPPQYDVGPCPVLYYLSGLTCNWENVTAKGGFQGPAAREGLIIIAPDTSPRSDDVPNEDRYDFAIGAGFYVDATETPWSKNYRMYSYITHELPAVLAKTLPNADFSRQGIFGHSMGGHGALTIAMRNPSSYQSLSAFAPIVAPIQVPWGQYALKGYLGPDQNRWADHDATALANAVGWDRDILIDQGDSDDFLEKELRPGLFSAACEAANIDLTLRMQPGYDHSYYFISSFMDDHIRWHAERLK